MSELPINQVVCGAFPAATRGWPDEKINLVMFSPPYWGLRNYGENVNAVWGGDPSCEHDFIEEKMTLVHENRNFSKGTQEAVHGEKGTTYIKKYDDKKAGFCSKCGAWYGQLGLEPTYQMYVEHMVEVGREIKRILRKDGSWYLNLGDTYAGGGGNSSKYRRGPRSCVPQNTKEIFPEISITSKVKGISPKCKLLIPCRVALALIDDGWICRNDIIWYKPNSMPSSVKDRLTCQTERVFHFVKSKKYYYDLDAIREPHKSPQGMNAYYKENREAKAKRFRRRESLFQVGPTESPHRGSKDVIGRYEKPASKYIGTELENSHIGTGRNPNIERMKKLGMVRSVRSTALGIDLRGKNPGDVIKLTKHDIAVRRFPCVNRKGGLGYTDPLHVKEYHPAGKNPGDVLTSRQESIVGHFREKGSGGHYDYGGLESPEGTHYAEGGRNPGDFWGITTKPSNDYWCPSCKDFVKQKKMRCVRCGVKVMAHFAVYPEELCIKPIKSSCPTQVCRKCKRPRERIVDIKKTGVVKRKVTLEKPFGKHDTESIRSLSGATYPYPERNTIGWTDCGCGDGFEPGIVLDPMCGRGTTLVVAKKLGLRYIGIDIKPEYCDMSRRCLSQVEWPLEAYSL